MTDRLAGLLNHYSLSARVFHSGALCGAKRFDRDHGYIHVLRQGPLEVSAEVHPPMQINEPCLLFYPRGAPHRFHAPAAAGADLVCATVDLGSTSGNPLALALPEVLRISLEELPELSTTLDLLFAEAFANHCGRQAAIDRLCEYLLIQLLRFLMDRGFAHGGLLAGLADPRLARAISAMHEAPAQDWSLEALADRAGMSRARFAARFREVVGQTPGHYLAAWRINVACSLLRQGRPVALAADRVGYASAPALARAFRAHLGCSPSEWLAQRTTA